MLRRVFHLALFAALLLTAGVLAFLLFGPEPSNDRDWTPDQARLPWAEFAGRRVAVYNVRNARYRSTEDYDVAWEDRSYDLDRLRSAWFVVEPFESQDWEGPIRCQPSRPPATTTIPSEICSSAPERGCYSLSPDSD